MEPDLKTGAAVIPGFWRAPTDNDVPEMLPYWNRFGVDALTSQLRSCTFTQDASTSSIRIETHTYVAPPILAWGFHINTTYTVLPTGSLSITYKMKPEGAHPTVIPRIGLNVNLTRRLDTATWNGPGPGESYPDKKSSQALGIYTLPIEALQTPYEVPQENGNRVDTRWVELCDIGGSGVRASAIETQAGSGKTFCWAASRHSAEELTRAKHPCDLKEENATLWRVDYEVAGVGSAACGPRVAPEHEVECRELEFGFKFEAI